MQKGEIKCTIYIKPHGKRKESTIRNIYKEDADWINEKKIKVSMEEITNTQYAIYFDYGKKLGDDPEEDPDEYIILSQGKSCEETIKQAVIDLKKIIKKIT